MRHANVALFVPHNGCPHQCSFCSQKTITGHVSQPTPEDVVNIAKSYKGEAGEAELAFFGGSFTAIERGYMLSLLKAAYPFVREKVFSGIRISTRPDAINNEILDICEAFAVSSIELGAQSMADDVLIKNMRGHTARDVEKASHLISSRGFSLGLQMMTGLCGDTPEKSVETARRIISLCPDTVRIYPTVLLPGTYLSELYEKGAYRPQTLDEAVELCAVLIRMFERKRISVIRVGLHDSPELKKDHIAGPYHPAFRELCESRILRNEIEEALGASRGYRTVLINPRDVSKAIGQKKSNLIYFENKGIHISFEQHEGVKPLSCKLKD